MNGELVLCAGCNRHVYAEESACPFCHRAPARGVAGKAMVVALSAGLSLVGCRGPDAPAPAYGMPAPTATATPPPATSASAPVTDPGRANATMYGMPPPQPSQLQPQPQPTSSVPAVDPGRVNVPMYGKPPSPPQPR